MIYLDNAATTFIKPTEVYDEVIRCMKETANAGRGGYGAAMKSSEIIFKARDAAAKLFNIENSERIVFTYNATCSLNTAIKGFVSFGGHVVISGMEHNSVLRPVQNLSDRGIITYSVAKTDRFGCVDSESIINEIRKNTQLIVITHVSNVCGTINDIYEIRRRTGRIPLLVDAAQSAGILNIDMQKLPYTMLAFPGHKGLYGPQGTGGLYIPDGVEVRTLVEGGTGSESENSRQPGIMPDKFESGTMNTSGIAGLGKGIEFVLKNTTEGLLSHELKLTDSLLYELKKINNVRTSGYEDCKNRTGVVAFNVKNRDCVEICTRLSDEYSVAARGGLHCSPLAHQSLGTFSSGAIRFSVGAFTTEEDIEFAVFALKKIIKS